MDISHDDIKSIRTYIQSLTNASGIFHQTLNIKQENKSDIQNKKDNTNTGPFPCYEDCVCVCHLDDGESSMNFVLAAPVKHLLSTLNDVTHELNDVLSRLRAMGHTESEEFQDPEKRSNIQRKRPHLKQTIERRTCQFCRRIFAEPRGVINHNNTYQGTCVEKVQNDRNASYLESGDDGISLPAKLKPAKRKPRESVAEEDLSEKLKIPDRQSRGSVSEEEVSGNRRRVTLRKSSGEILSEQQENPSDKKPTTQNLSEDKDEEDIADSDILEAIRHMENVIANDDDINRSNAADDMSRPSSNHTSIIDVKDSLDFETDKLCDDIKSSDVKDFKVYVNEDVDKVDSSDDDDDNDDNNEYNASDPDYNITDTDSDETDEYDENDYLQQKIKSNKKSDSVDHKDRVNMNRVNNNNSASKPKVTIHRPQKFPLRKKTTNSSKSDRSKSSKTGNLRNTRLKQLPKCRSKHQIHVNLNDTNDTDVATVNLDDSIKNEKDFSENQNNGDAETSQGSNEVDKNVKMYPCRVCSKLIHMQHMRTHLATHRTSLSSVTKEDKEDMEEDKTYPCRICGKQIRPQRMSYHISTHNEPRYNCNICGKLFYWRGEMSRHQHRIHGIPYPEKTRKLPVMKSRPVNTKVRPKQYIKHMTNRPEADKLADALTPYPCHVCGKQIPKRRIASHLTTHGEPRFHCKDCGKGFFWKSDVNRHHKRVHDSQNHEYQCTECGKVFRHDNTLRSHQFNTHVNAREHGCTMCDLRCNTAAKLRRHVKIVHDNYRPHACTLCDHASCSAFNLRLHMKVHYRDKQ